MQDLKRTKKKITSKPVEMTNIASEEVNEIPEELDRSWKHKPDHGCKPEPPCKPDHECKPEPPCKPDCGCKDHYDKDDCHKEKCHCKCEEKCEPCEEASADKCIKNKCSDACCSPIEPERVNIHDCIPYAIEAERIFDTFKFQLVTDASALRGRNLYFDYEVVEVIGSVPKGTAVNVVIDKICFNYTDVVIIPGLVSLEDRVVSPVKEIVEEQPTVEVNCPDFDHDEEEGFVDTSFEYNVSGKLNLNCCRDCKGERTNYKEKGLRVVVRDLVLELRGNCGCTEVVVLAYPAIKNGCGELERVQAVVFEYNTLSADSCLPANGKSVTLRQEFQTALTVDCIGKTLLKSEYCNCNSEDYYKFCVPNGIDVIMCLEEVISILVSEQIVVLGVNHEIKPRVADTFAKVCDFDEINSICRDHGCNDGCHPRC